MRWVDMFSCRSNSTKMALNILVLPIFWWKLGDTEDTKKLQECMGQYEAITASADARRCGFKYIPLRQVMRGWTLEDWEKR